MEHQYNESCIFNRLTIKVILLVFIQFSEFVLVGLIKSFILVINMMVVFFIQVINKKVEQVIKVIERQVEQVIGVIIKQVEQVIKFINTLVEQVINRQVIKQVVQVVNKSMLAINMYMRVTDNQAKYSSKQVECFINILVIVAKHFDQQLPINTKYSTSFITEAINKDCCQNLLVYFNPHKSNELANNSMVHIGFKNSKPLITPPKVNKYLLTAN